MSTLTTQDKAVREPAKAAADVSPQLLNPRVDILEQPKAYSLVADFPGVAKADVEVQLDNGELTISGRRTNRSGVPLEYRRVFSVDPAIDSERISAQLENGVLTVNLPKPEAVKPRRITIS